MICSADCDDDPGDWDTWGVNCVDPFCFFPDWSGSQDVVWGAQCGGADCSSGTSWSASDPVYATTVVWGTTDGDTVVWGTSCTDPSCEPVVWHNP